MPLVSYQQQAKGPLANVLFHDSAVGEIGAVLRRHFEDDALQQASGSVLRFETAVLFGAKKRVNLLSGLTNDWDSYGAPAPNRFAAQNALRILDKLHDELTLAKVLPSAEGGIGICFFHNEKYADIECTNQGEFIGVYYTGAEMPRVLDIANSDESIDAALTQIRNHLIG